MNKKAAHTGCEDVAVEPRADNPFAKHYIVEQNKIQTNLLRARSAWQRRYAVQQPEGTYFTAAMAAQAGDIDDAFRELNRAIDARGQFLVFAKIEPLFDPLRGDARFTAALKRLNSH